MPNNNKKLKKIVTEKKDECKLKIVNEMKLSGKYQKQIWRLLDRLEGLHYDKMFKDAFLEVDGHNTLRKCLGKRAGILSTHQTPLKRGGGIASRITRHELSDASSETGKIKWI